MARSSQPAGYQAPAVRKAFDLIRFIAQSSDDVGLSQLAQELGFSKSTTHGLVRALMDEGVLACHPQTRKYSLGPAIFQLALGKWNPFRIQKQAQPHLDQLRDQTGQSVFLGCLTPDRAIVIATSESNKALKISAPPGSTLPIMAGAIGKLYLARLSNSEARQIIRTKGLKAYTPASIVTEDAYLAELAKVRETGYALDDEEYLPGIRAIAVDLNNHWGLPMAVWVVGFTSSLNNGILPQIIQHTMAAVNQVKVC